MMPLPLIPLAYAGLATAARFALPHVVKAIPTLFNGARTAAWWGTKQAVKHPIIALGTAGVANYATDGAVGEAALTVGEGAVKVIGAVPGGDKALAATGQAALKVGGAAAAGLGEVGVSAAKRYGPAAVERVTEAVPPVLTRGVGTVAGAVKKGAQKTADGTRDVLERGGIKVDDAQRAGAAFKGKAEEVAGDAADAALETAEDLSGGMLSAAELRAFGNMAQREAANNKFIQAGLLLGGLSGAMSGESLRGKGLKAVMNALLFAAAFGAIGHFLFGKRSELVEAAVDKLNHGFNKLATGFGDTKPDVAQVEVRPRRLEVAPAPSMM